MASGCDGPHMPMQFQLHIIVSGRCYNTVYRYTYNRNVFNLEHDQSKEVPAYILEAWIVENPTQDTSWEDVTNERRR